MTNNLFKWTSKLVESLLYFSILKEDDCEDLLKGKFIFKFEKKQCATIASHAQWRWNKAEILPSSLTIRVNKQEQAWARPRET